MTDRSLPAGVIADHYRPRIGFDLAWAEGKQTNGDNGLTRLRQLEFAGEMLDITPHVKHENKAKKLWLRVHLRLTKRRGYLLSGTAGIISIPTARDVSDSDPDGSETEGRPARLPVRQRRLSIRLELPAHLACRRR